MTRLDPLKTLPGMSVRREFEQRMEEERARTIDEVLALLGAAGLFDAAELVRAAAYDSDAGLGSET